MNSTTFSVKISRNRAAYEQSREQFWRAVPGQHAAIAKGRLIAVNETFNEGVEAARRLTPALEQLFLSRVNKKPAFDQIDDFFGEVLHSRQTDMNSFIPPM